MCVTNKGTKVSMDKQTITPANKTKGKWKKSKEVYDFKYFYLKKKSYLCVKSFLFCLQIYTFLFHFRRKIKQRL